MSFLLSTTKTRHWADTHCVSLDQTRGATMSSFPTRAPPVTRSAGPSLDPSLQSCFRGLPMEKEWRRAGTFFCCRKTLADF